MPVTKKPQIDVDKADRFIGGAKADTVKPHKRKTVKTVNKARPQAAGPPKKTKMTFYMTPEMYLKWKAYELAQLQSGKKVSFQGVVEKYMKRILG